MNFRHARTHRPLARLALFAIGLLSIMPTISQLVAGMSGRHDAAASMAMAMSMPMENMDHASAPTAKAACADHHASARETDAAPCPPGAAPHEDHWHKCGYCDFLTHTPALQSFDFVVLFATLLPPVIATHALESSAHEAYFPAAQPRGPPLA
jgi:hypothetical protein